MKFRLNDFTRGDVIRMIREWSDMTQQEFAASINKSKATIRKYESGEIDYNISTLLEIAEKHNVTITVEKPNDK